MKHIFFWCLLGLLVTACEPSQPRNATPHVKQELSPTLFLQEPPQNLSEWGLLERQGNFLEIASESFPYRLNTSLFTDYAHKLRTIWIPDGAASIDEQQRLDFPVGTVITKTFYYPRGKKTGEVLKDADEDAYFLDGALDLSRIHLIETRLLVRGPQAWMPYSYVWNEEQSDATLKKAGAIKPLVLVSGASREEFSYIVPTLNQCAGCHATNATTRELHPIGPAIRHLNRPYDETTTSSQLEEMIARDMLQAEDVSWRNVAAARWGDEQETVERRARAYLDINCAHCHNANGPADTSGLFLEPTTANGPQLGFCKMPIAAGSGTGGRQYAIYPGDAARSIFVYRLASTDPGSMMPELGRSLAHEEGVALVAAWIDGLQGQCGE